MTLHQTLTIARVELRRWWRRPFLPMMLAIPVLMIGVFINHYQFSVFDAQLNTSLIEALNTNRATEILSALFVLLSLFAAVFFTESLPRDTQLDVRGFLESLPLSSSSYIIGKLLGALAATFQVYSSALLLLLALTRIFVGPIQLGPLLLLGLLYTIPLLIIVALSVLLASPFRQQRPALGIGIVVILLTLAHTGLSADAPESLLHRTALLSAFSNVTALVIRGLDPWEPSITWGQVAFTTGTQTLLVGLIACAVIGWRRRAH